MNPFADFWMRYPLAISHSLTETRKASYFLPGLVASIPVDSVRGSEVVGSPCSRMGSASQSFPMLSFLRGSTPSLPSFYRLIFLGIHFCSINRQ
jgi:hypothetical protein